MSKIKPVAWLVEDCEDSCFATVDAQMVADFMTDTDSVSTPLYTAGQLTEAVAAERDAKERAVRDVLHTAIQRLEIETIFRVIEDRLKTDRIFLSPEYQLVCKGFADNLKSDLEAIRSAAK